MSMSLPVARLRAAKTRIVCVKRTGAKSHLRRTLSPRVHGGHIPDGVLNWLGCLRPLTPSCRYQPIDCNSTKARRKRTYHRSWSGSKTGLGVSLHPALDRTIWSGRAPHGEALVGRSALAAECGRATTRRWTSSSLLYPTWISPALASAPSITVGGQSLAEDHLNGRKPKSIAKTALICVLLSHPRCLDGFRESLRTHPR